MKLHRASIASLLLVIATLAQPVTAQDLSITKLADRTRVKIGETITYYITVTNLGPGTATGVVFGDSLPDQLNLVSFTVTQGTVINQTFCSVPSMDPGASVTATLLATPIDNPAQSERRFTNPSSIVASAPTDTNSSNNTASVRVHIIGTINK
ncbi:MAG TPA: DUF11 domain-containing protein [Planctomycetota bacterium]|nr:DUF11 domain-containing protein [Planctomycetota bacterium]